MRPKQRIRKIYTQTDVSQKVAQINDPLLKTNNINIKDLQLTLENGQKNVSDYKNTNKLVYKNTHFFTPNKFNKINRKQLIKKLPDINLGSFNTMCRPIKLNPIDQKSEEIYAGNSKNTFLLNSLFQILKPTENNQKFQLSKIKEKSLKITQKKNILVDSFYQNEFINISNSSTKNRGPRIIQNQITRLSSHNNIARRRIVSQQKSRPRYKDKQLQKLKQTTFQHFKRCVNKNQDQVVQSHVEPKQNFENLQIITFYNKFPTVKKKTQLQSNQRSNMQKIELKKKIDSHIVRNNMVEQLQQENQFIFNGN